MTLSEYLTSLGNPKLMQTLAAIADSVRDIAANIHAAETGKSGTRNSFGEEQMELDVLADGIIFKKLAMPGTVAMASSEERAEGVPLGGTGYSVAFDPLDGSSLIDVNLAIGTIFGIWNGDTLLGKSGRDLAASGYAVYGPRTSLVLAAGGSVHEFTYHPAYGSWRRVRENLQVAEGKMFAPGNLRASSDHAKYRELINYWIDQRYTLRYSGGMVPDINQIILKGKGIFTYPGSASAPAKLRLLYECAPLAYVIETAGGASSDGTQSILDKVITAYDERTPVALGSKDEVQRFEEYCG